VPVASIQGFGVPIATIAKSVNEPRRLASAGSETIFAREGRTRIMNVRMLFCLMLWMLMTASLAHAELDVYLEGLSVSASGDLGGYSTQLGARFGLSRGEVEVVLSSVDSPADAALVLWLGEKSRQPREQVLQIYREEKRQGWGALAKRLGIKPGSAEFHALKNGDLDFHPDGRAGGKSGNGKPQGKHKDHGKHKKN
jgi:hypothetical protein